VTSRIVRWNARERAYRLRQVVFGHETNLIIRCMSATRILWGRILVVLTVVLVMMWAATQWTAWRLGYQPQLGQPWFELTHGVPVYLPPAFFWWWYVYDAYAPRLFVEGACIAVSGGIISIMVAFAMSVWRAREAETAATYGLARWANQHEVRATGLAGRTA
jgi:type IV secretion system protein VirD4